MKWVPFFSLFRKNSQIRNTRTIITITKAEILSTYSLNNSLPLSVNFHKAKVNKVDIAMLNAVTALGEASHFKVSDNFRPLIVKADVKITKIITKLDISGLLTASLNKSSARAATLGNNKITINTTNNKEDLSLILTHQHLLK